MLILRFLRTGSTTIGTTSGLAASGDGALGADPKADPVVDPAMVKGLSKNRYRNGVVLKV
jgi:hypothetical protein